MRNDNYLECNLTPRSNLSNCHTYPSSTALNQSNQIALFGSRSFFPIFRNSVEISCVLYIVGVFVCTARILQQYVLVKRHLPAAFIRRLKVDLNFHGLQPTVPN